MHIDAGKLDKRIQIIQLHKTTKPNGYKSETESVVRSCWAQFFQTSGRELVKANAEMGEIKTRFLIRWTRTPISRKMLVRYSGRDYEIEYINGYGDSREYIELWCRLDTLEG